MAPGVAEPTMSSTSLATLIRERAVTRTVLARDTQTFSSSWQARPPGEDDHLLPLPGWRGVLRGAPLRRRPPSRPGQHARARGYGRPQLEQIVAWGASVCCFRGSLVVSGRLTTRQRTVCYAVRRGRVPSVIFSAGRPQHLARVLFRCCAEYRELDGQEVRTLRVGMAE